MTSQTGATDVERPHVEKVKETAAKLMQSIRRVLVGKDQAIEETLCTLLCQGHLLVEDVPGVGKTIRARPWPAR